MKRHRPWLAFEPRRSSGLGVEALAFLDLLGGLDVTVRWWAPGNLWPADASCAPHDA